MTISAICNHTHTLLLLWLSLLLWLLLLLSLSLLTLLSLSLLTLSLLTLLSLLSLLSLSLLSLSLLTLLSLLSLSLLTLLLSLLSLLTLLLSLLSLLPLSLLSLSLLTLSLLTLLFLLSLSLLSLLLLIYRDENPFFLLFNVLFTRCFNLIWTACVIDSVTSQTNASIIQYVAICKIGIWEKWSIITLQWFQNNFNPLVHYSLGNWASLVFHWNRGPSGWDFFCLPWTPMMDSIFLTYHKM